MNGEWRRTTGTSPVGGVGAGVVGRDGREVPEERVEDVSPRPGRGASILTHRSRLGPSVSPRHSPYRSTLVYRHPRRVDRMCPVPVDTPGEGDDTPVLPTSFPCALVRYRGRVSKGVGRLISPWVLRETPGGPYRKTPSCRVRRVLVVHVDPSLVAPTTGHFHRRGGGR